MRVLFLSTTTASSKSGSAQVHRLMKLKEGLDEHGFNTSWLALRDLPIARPSLLTSLNLPFVWTKIKEFDSIHAVGDAAYVADVWKPMHHASVVYDVDADDLAEAYMHWEVRRGLRTAFWVFQAAVMSWIAFKSSDYFITVSRPLKERLIQRRHVLPSRLRIVRNGVDTQLFQPAFGRPDGPFTLCYAGGFHIWQGLDNLVDACQRLKGESVRLRIIGFRSENSDLKAQIAASLGDMVELIDRVPQHDLVNLLAEAHVLVIPRLPHPAVEIAFPTKFSEYLAMGKPVIVSDVDETADLVREYKCGLVSAPDPQSLANTIRQAVNLTNAELVEMGQNGRHLAETVFDWRVVCHQYAELLREWHT